MLNISLAAEKIGSIWGFPITNSLLTTWFVMILLVVFSWLATRNLSFVPKGVQTIAEVVVGGLHDFFASVVGEQLIDKFFPLVASLFIFIILSNWIGLLPGVSTIGFYHGAEFVPLLRAPTSDLNLTVGLALFTVLAIQYYGFAVVGFHYHTRFFNFKNPIMFYVGILELLSETSRIISFAFRLFGNIFAGEVLLAVIAFLTPFIVPLPFLTLELFVGFIQALVFSMLAAVFLKVAVSHETA
jgi:F-type H+-transporting ATPase subunit a